MGCSRRPRREPRRDGPAEYRRRCSPGPNGGTRWATRSVPSRSSRSRHETTPSRAVFRSAKTAPVGSAQAVAAATGAVVCGIGTDGREVGNHDGEPPWVVVRCPGCFAVVAQGERAPRCWWSGSRASRISTRRLKPGSNRLKTMARSGWYARVCRWSRPRAPSGEAGARGRTPSLGTRRPATRRRFGERYRRAIPTSRPASRHGGLMRPARC